jgi:hypothetical protein
MQSFTRLFILSSLTPCKTNPTASDEVVTAVLGQCAGGGGWKQMQKYMRIGMAVSVDKWGSSKPGGDGAEVYIQDKGLLAQRPVSRHKRRSKASKIV